MPPKINYFHPKKLLPGRFLAVIQMQRVFCEIEYCELRTQDNCGILTCETHHDVLQ
jgi:hypothetical protein